MIPNTTPTPNELYNGEMKKMNDTELRIVLVVTRATLGWIINKETGMRKKEDWISQKQLIERTGRSNRAISNAISSCIKNGWIEARDKNGKLLVTPQERARRKVFYRLGKIFLDTLSTGEESSSVESGELNAKSGELNDTNLVKKVHNTKEILTKETIQKISEQSSQAFNKKEIDDLIDKFKAVNPFHQKLFGMPPQREAMAELLQKIGREKLEKLLDALPDIVKQPTAPRITTPYQLMANFGKLGIFLQQQRSIQSKYQIGQI